jgi:phosphoenolpyruvate carboxykinase (GTP)
MLDRVAGQANGIEHLFGTTPRYDDLSWTGVDFSRELFERITSIDHAAWQLEIELHNELFSRLQNRLPPALSAVKERIEKKLVA